jgi:hypothetical protein
MTYLNSLMNWITRSLWTTSRSDRHLPSSKTESMRSRRTKTGRPRWPENGMKLLLKNKAIMTTRMLTTLLRRPMMRLRASVKHHSKVPRRAFLRAVSDLKYREQSKKKVDLIGTNQLSHTIK